MTTATRSQSRHFDRVPNGVPTGGQFATAPRAETPITLAQAIEETYPDAPARPTVPSPITVEASEMPQTVREALENRDVVDCPACWGSSRVAGTDEMCGLCDHGFVTQTDLEEFVATHGDTNPVGYFPGYLDKNPEPDFESILDARSDSAYERGGAAAEWGGMDVAS